MGNVRVDALALAVLVTASGALASDRAKTPQEATVFVRVVGTARVETEGAVTEAREERDVQLGTGSGFVFTPYGHVLTNHHVIESRTLQETMGGDDVIVELLVERIEVGLPGSPPQRLEAILEAVDPVLDLAVLSVSAADLPYLALGDSESARQGEAVQVYGFPFGERVEVGHVEVRELVPRVSVSRGALAARRSDDQGRAAYLQTSADVNPGNSGGPLVDEDGYVLGVVRSRLGEAASVGFAVPVNVVKEFLTLNGYDQMLGVEPLRLGGEQSLDDKGVELPLPDTLEDVSPVRLQAFSDPSQGAIELRLDRLWTPWSVAEIEQALMDGGTFGKFRASEKLEPARPFDGGAIVGRAKGVDPDTEEPRALVYALYESGPEKVLVRYEGPPDSVAYNRSVLERSAGSVVMHRLLGDEVAAPISPDHIEWSEIPLPDPSAPNVVVPRGWRDEVAAPFPCRALPPLTSALALSPEGDFTVSFRVGYWKEPIEAPVAAGACGGGPSGIYAYGVEYLGVRYVVEGAFVTGDGTLQLELVAPESKHELVRDLARSWITRNR